MIIETQPVGPFWTNTYVVGCRVTHEAVIIDPGYEPEVILGFLEKHHLNLRHILCTHGHIDHVGAVAEIKAATGAPIWLHPDDLFIYEQVTEWAPRVGMRVTLVPPDHFLSDGDEVPFGKYVIKAIHTPGHTPGGMTYLVGETAFVGDTLFAGSVGRTDLPGGSWPDLVRSISQKLFSLGDQVIVYSGHGPPTTIGKERRTNPFLRF